MCLNGLICLPLLVCLTASSLFAIKANLEEDKFFAYGGPEFRSDTEIRGTVVYISGEVFLLATDWNYRHLGLKGNQILGSPNETGNRADELCNAPPLAYSMYGPTLDPFPHIFPKMARVPIIKLETYRVGGRADSSNGRGWPMVRENGYERPLRLGDRIKVSGLYVIDYSHPPYCDLHTASWTYMRGFYKAAYAHSELHPYDTNSLEVIGPESESSDEVHTVVAPVYPELYSKTYGWNKMWGVAGHMVDSAMRTDQTASIILKAPPRSPGDLELRAVETERTVTGSGNATFTETVHPGSTAVTVTMRASGTDIYNPLVYHARFTARWVPRAPAPSYGSVVRMLHAVTNCRLHSHLFDYGQPQTSGQQQVTCFAGRDDNDDWIIRGPHGYAPNYRQGEPLRHGDIVRLEHRLTRRNLHSHSGHPSPVTRQQEVTCFGENGFGDGNDDWRVELLSGSILERGARFRLVHVNTGHALHSHLGFQHPLWTRNQQEVTAFSGRDDNDLWIIVD